MSTMQYVRYELSATIGGVRVSASSISDEHRDKTLKVWRGMRAKNITVTEHLDAQPLPRWRIRIPTHSYRGYLDIEISASSKEIAMSKIEADKKLKLKPWQIITAKVELAEGGK